MTIALAKGENTVDAAPDVQAGQEGDAHMRANWVRLRLEWGGEARAVSRLA